MRVVLADSSRTVQKAVSRILRARGHDVVAFSDGREALEQVRCDENVDALITSTEPMGLSGFELCWETRLISSGRRPIYVIMMSSNREQHILCEALDSGADDFIDKPPASEELYARMRAAERVSLLERNLDRLASIDSLTGVLNRRAFFDEARAITARARAGMPLAAVMMDVDHFKRINDSFGHHSGDKALCAVAQAATTSMPEVAVLGRLGGEEFALLLPGCSVFDAATLADQLRHHIASLRVGTDKGMIELTCSLGVSEWKADDDIDLLLKRADIALYQAKTGGRNRVVVASDAIAWTSDGIVAGKVAPNSVVRARPRE